MNMIAVTGANGQLGQMVIDALLVSQAPHNIVALVRNPDNASSLKEKGVVVRKANYNLPETLTDALDGVSKLLLISGTEFGKRVEQHKAVIDAAIRQNVSLIAYTSLIKASTSPLLLAQEHKDTEAYLKDVNAPFVILRNGWYTENYTENVASVLAMGAVAGAAKQGVISTASRQDYAEAAAAVLVTKQDYIGKTLELAGDSGFTLSEYAQAISEATGKHIDFIDMDEQAYRQALIDAGLPEAMAVAIADSEHYAATGWLHDDSHTLSALIGRPTTSLQSSLDSALNK
ncbi:SDR family oxidoreductase [Alteromonas sp. 009811495]|uniref:SDR family oxidoreductase n=1 Tax=Alteromonas sp. 009811495 TaxID=3002962 RepID=UPI00237EAB01|nr:SDR family oxidoreductase [Alteromonas sp. 009811495]WDT87265.1 SDR family oxidoreductase [Alteromonas sp. 009811495]